MHVTRDIRPLRILVAGLLFALALLGSALPAHAAGWTGQTLDPGAGQGTTTVLYGGNPHVFDRTADGGALRHCWWTGSSWPCETLDPLGGQGRIAALVVGTQLHVFYMATYNTAVYGPDASSTYQLSGLRHMWYDTAWHSEWLDQTSHVAGDVSAVLYGGNPHVFYEDVNATTFRHAWWTGSRWSFEAFDGNQSAGVNGQTHDWSGTESSAVVVGNRLHVFYSDDAARSLRHAWYDWGGQWHYETLDGAGSPGTNGRSTGWVTAGLGGIATVVYGGNPHVFFTGQSTGLRHCWWGGAGWSCETLDGTPFAYTYFQTPSSEPAAGVYGAQLDLYYSANNDLMHMWYYGGWHREVMDQGSSLSPVGLWPAAATWGNQDHVYYQGHHDLDHRWYTP